MPKDFKKSGLMTLRILVSIGLTSILFLGVDLGSLLSSLMRIDIFLFIIAYSVTALTILIKSYKWQLLLEIQGVKLSLLSIQAITYISVFFNNFFLGSLGGDAFKIYKTKNYSKFKSGSVSSIMMDRITGMPVMLSIIIAFGIVNLLTKDPLLTWEQFLVIVAIGLGLCIACFVVLKVLIISKQIRGLKRFPRLLVLLEDFGDSIKANSHNRRYMLVCFFLAFLFQITRVFAIYFLILSAGVNPNIMQLTFVVPLITLITMVPISVNGLGIQEGGFFLYFENIGLDATTATLISFLPRIMMLISSLIGAVIYIVDENRKT